MLEPQRFPREAWIHIAAGLAWLWYAASFGVVGFFFSVIPGCLMLSSGVSTLLYAGDLRIQQFAALGGLLGIPLAIPAFWVAGVGTGLLLTALSAAAFVAAGWLAVRHEPDHDEVPEPEPTLRVAAEVAFDEAILATMLHTVPMPGGHALPRVRDEVEHARELFRDRGWLEKPESYHERPPLLESPQIRARSQRGLAFEELRFESGYEPRPEEPGRERWLSRQRNRTAWAWVLRHDAAPRPWLVCIHGYQMGQPWMDLVAFRAAWLHHTLGLNVLMPVLPLHGPRTEGRRSGDGFVSGDALDTVHAVAQAVWDMRRLLGWVRAQGDTPVGVHGLSLGGYHTAVLTSIADDLACAVAGIPATDLTRAMWRHGPPLAIRYFERRGLVHEGVSEVLRVVSPLSLKPRVPLERRYIFGALADRLVPADQVRDLWRHWEKPRIVWYPGGHVTFRLHEPVRRLLRDALREGGLTD
jgi:hypothetical protein